MYFGASEEQNEVDEVRIQANIDAAGINANTGDNQAEEEELSNEEVEENAEENLGGTVKKLNFL